MVAGQPPFKGKTDSHTRVSIIDHDPVPLVQHVADVPRQLERIVAKALAKDKLKRYQTITDLKLDLEQLRDELHTSGSVELTQSATRETHVDMVTAVPTSQKSKVSTAADSATASSGSGVIPPPQSKRWLLYGVAGAFGVLLLVVAAVLFARSSAPPIN
jgi:serine/threonine-protein kinase